jgi:chromosome segregation ATPase
MLIMDCDLCGRLAGPQTRFHCPTCARNALYPVRLEQLSSLAEKEAMGRMVEAATQTTGVRLPRESLSLSGKIVDSHDCAKASAMDRLLSETVMTKDRLDALKRRAEELRLEMEEYRRSISEQKTSIQRRQSDKDSATYGLLDRESKEQDALQSSMRRIRRRWELKHNEIVEGRAALCKPAARLAGLRRHRRPREDGTMREYYTIACELPVFDLRELHSKLLASLQPRPH